MFTASPLTIWSPRWVMQAKPCTSAMQTDTPTAASSPSQTDPVTLATAAAAKALPSSLPSREMSMTPERSEKRPARAQKMSGVASRRVASRVSRSWNANSLTSAPSAVPAPAPGPATAPALAAEPVPEHESAHAGASPMRRRDRCAIRRASGGFSMKASAPENRMMSPWMTGSRSRVMVRNSRSSSLPPW